MNTGTHLGKVIDTSERIAALAENSLRSLDLLLERWPPDFRAIIWDAVAAAASSRADDARKAA